MRFPRLVFAATMVWACGGDSAGPGDGAVRFDFPLIGRVAETFFFVNYVDEAQGTGIVDYQCGPKAYDGHLGTDVVLPSFAVMDSGVSVIAAAPGVVAAAHDGEFDRHKTWTAGAQWNYVALRHADGSQTIYGHLKRNSVGVSLNQEVPTGAVLGQVGSSGISDMPHLHFELRDAAGEVVDPWQGPCGADRSRWRAQPAYTSVRSLIASGVTDATLTLDLVKDPPPEVETLSTADDRVTMWVHLMNVAPGSMSEFRFYRPDGALYGAVALTHEQFYSMSWWWAWLLVSGNLTQVGTWRIEYRNAGALLAQRSFVLVSAPAPVRAPPLAEGQPRMGTGGGGLRQPRQLEAPD